MTGDLHPEHLDRLPDVFRQLLAALDAAGWDQAVSVSGPVRVGDVHREVVEVAASTRTGHRVRAWFTADAPPGAARPPYSPLLAVVGQGMGVGDTSVQAAVAYVRRHPVFGGQRT